MSDYRSLRVWNRAVDFIARAYEQTNSFPSHEMYGLTSQIRRAATSIALNIAEGASSGYDPEYQRFLRLAIRSANEVATGFEIAKRLNYVNTDQANSLIREADEIAAMLQGLSKSLNKAPEATENYLLGEPSANDQPLATND